MNIRILSIASLTGLILFSFSSCLKDDSEAQIAEEKKILADYIQANNITVQPTESGLYYIETLAGTGDSVAVDDWMEIKYTARLVSNNQVVMTSEMQTAKDNNIYLAGTYYGPTRLVQGQIRPIALNEGISKMRDGGKARLIFPSDIGLGGTTSGNVPAYSSLIFDVELVKVIPDIIQYEGTLVQAFLEANDMSPDSTAEGIWFKQTGEGTGDLPKEGNVVSVTYSGKFLNGTIFDNSGKSFNLTIGNYSVIPGFEEAVKLIKKGGSGKVVIPYNNAYGVYGRFDNYGRYVIPPYTSLVFDISVTFIGK